MNTFESPEGAESRPSGTQFKNPRAMKVIQTLSRVVTAIFLVALVWVIYQAIINGNPLPVWAWIGIILFAATVIGLIVAFVVYRGVARQAGPFDTSPSKQVTRQLIEETRQVEAGGARSLRAEINMALGELQLKGGATGVLDAAFTYDDADWKQPEVSYAVDDAGQGTLVMKQTATHRPAMRQGRCEWIVRLDKDLPIDLKVKFGAGKLDLVVGGLNLTRLRVDSGVGKLNLDFSGEWRRSMQAFIKAGIGDTTLLLPQNVGVRIQSSIGLGSVQPYGLSWDGEAYINELYDQKPVKLDIIVEGGVGKLHLGQGFLKKEAI